MNQKIRMRLLPWSGLLAGLLCLFSGCGSSAPVTPVAPQGPTLAVDSVAAGWKPVSPVWRYEGDALFDYFRSGADIYREYGCIEVQVQDYANQDGDEVRVEVFATRTPAGAYGLFSLKTQPGGEIVDVGVQGWQERFTLNFWRGHTQATLDARKITGTAVKRIDFLAVSVDQGLTGDGELPPIMNLLPEKDLLPKGRVYVAGPASLRQAMGRDPWQFDPPVQGALGNYCGVGGEHALLILEYEDKAAAAEAGRRAAPKGSALNSRHTRLLVVLPEPLDRYLYAYIGPKNPTRAREALEFAVMEFRRNHP
jgi:uncharacterized protein DUF6599